MNTSWYKHDVSWEIKNFRFKPDQKIIRLNSNFSLTLAPASIFKRRLKAPRNSSDELRLSSEDAFDKRAIQTEISLS